MTFSQLLQKITCFFIVLFFLKPAWSQHDVAITQWSSSWSTCGHTEYEIKVKIANYGPQLLDSINIESNVNGVVQISILHVNLNPSDSAIFTVDSFFIEQSINQVTVSAHLLNGWLDNDSTNDAISATVNAALNGIYTINQQGNGDYNSIQSAVNDLDSFGVCGPVIFQLDAGIYTESIELTTYPGMSTVNSITFLGDSTGANSVVWYKDTLSTQNAIITLDSASFYDFVGLDLINLDSVNAHSIQLNNGCSELNFVSNTFRGTFLSSGGLSTTLIYSEDGLSEIDFLNNNFINGGCSVYISGDSLTFNEHILFQENYFENVVYSFVWLDHVHTLNFLNNTVVKNQSAFGSFSLNSAVLHLKYVTGNSLIEKNFIMNITDYTTNGFDLQHVDGVVSIVNNKIRIRKNVVGYSINKAIKLKYVQRAEIYYNSILVGNSVGPNSCIRIESSDVDMANNILKNDGLGIMVYCDGNSTLSSDYNAFYHGINSEIITLGSNLTLASWQAASGSDSNSVVLSNLFSDDSLLTVCNPALHHKGISIPSITQDINEEWRMSPPCVGAEEFFPSNNFGQYYDNFFCHGDSVQISLNNYDTVIWNGVDTSLTQWISSGGAYWVTVVGGCGTGSDTIHILESVPVDLPDSVLICYNDSILLSDTNSVFQSYLWNTGHTNGYITTDSTGMYTLQTTDTYGCSSVDSVYVRSFASVDLGDSSIQICADSILVLSSNIPGDYLWSDNSTDSSLLVSSSGWHWLQLEDSTGCISRDSIEVDVLPLPIADISFSLISNSFLVGLTHNSQHYDSIFWDFGDGNTSTEDEPYHIYEDNEPYTILARVVNECGADTAYLFFFVETNDLEVDLEYSIYPNPFQSSFLVDLSQIQQGTVELILTDITGRRIEKRVVNTSNMDQFVRYEAHSWAEGVYLLTLRMGDSSVTHQIIKQ